MNIIPCGHRVVIKPYELEKVDEVFAKAKKMGLEIPDLDEHKREKNAVNRGILVSIGVNAWKAFDDGTPWATVGDHVLYARYAGTKVKDGDVEYIVCSDEDIVCILKDSKNE